MSVTRVLLDILVVLLASKVAAEAAERARVPAVVGEILAGMIIGPYALALIQGGEVLHVLAELGVILLLFEVGMEMDIRELGAVGRAALTVAVLGIVAPFAGGYAVSTALGLTTNEAIFIAAAMTATSVGITARVFGDLRALASVEARTVLGAAVADDVIGLVILTVVVRVVTGGTVTLSSVGTIIGVAIAFLVVTSFVGLKTAPRLFEFVARHGRSSGTLVAVALAFTLGVSELAHAARLAPIVGAFVAGLSLGRTPSAERIRRELTPVGHLFIPVFFLQIGIDAEFREFGHSTVLRLAAALLVVAVVGKLVSGVGLLGAPGDRLLVGIGMIPRGEVGLIFATIGLREGVLGKDVYAALLVVVLVTTLLTPPALRWRLLRVRASRTRVASLEPEPPGGWLTVDEPKGVIELAAEPPPDETLRVALEAALHGERCRPGPRLLDWLSALPEDALAWDDASRSRLFDVLDNGGDRSWRFLWVTGVLDRALPELAESLARRQADPFELDPSGAMRWPTLSRVQSIPARHGLSRPERLLLAAVVLDTSDAGPDAVDVARRLVRRIGLGPATEEAVTALVGDAALLAAAAHRSDSLEEEHVLQLAVHLGSAEQADALFLLTVAVAELEPWERRRLEDLRELVAAVLARPELTGRDASVAVEQRCSEAMALSSDAAVRERIAATPRAHVLATPAADLARQSALCEPAPTRHVVRTAVTPLEDERHWRVEFATADRVGLLARETLVLADYRLEVLDASVVTWGDGTALASFGVVSRAAPDANALREDLQAILGRPLAPEPMPGLRLTFDDHASPWHTLCRVEGDDRPGLLHAVTTAFALAGASVHSARIGTVEGRADDWFGITDRAGHKLDHRAQETIQATVERGGPAGRWSSRVRLRRSGASTVVTSEPTKHEPLKHNGNESATETKHVGDGGEIPRP